MFFQFTCCLSFAHSIPGGFAVIKNYFPDGSSIHVPLNVEQAPFNGDVAVPILPIQAYTNYEKAISALPTPLLISCKSGARASAVAAAFLGIQNKQTWEQVAQEGEALGM